MTIKVKSLTGLIVTALVSGCGGGSSDNKVVEKQNQAPTAVIATSETQISENTMISISGTQSTDPEGDALSYFWSVTNEDGKTVIVSDLNSSSIEFKAEEFGIYQVELKVKDNTLFSSVVTTQVQVLPSEDDYPIAVVSGNRVVKVGSANWLSSEGSYGAHEQLISYHWEIINKPSDSNATLELTANATAYFVPDLTGLYEIQMTVENVEDALQANKVLTVQVDDVVENSAPIAKVNYDLRNYTVGETVKFSATESSDPDGNELTYQWLLLNKPQSSESQLVGADSEFAEFIADVTGEYKVRLTVNDSLLSSEEEFSVTVSNENIIPIADAGNNIDAVLGIIVTLDGANSYDPDGGVLTYQWKLVSKPTESSFLGLTNPSLSQLSELVFEPDATGEYIFSLEVYDGEDYSVADTVKVKVTDNQLPVAQLSDDKVVYNSGNVQVSGSTSYDPEGENLTYKWSLINKPDAYSGELSTLTSLALLSPTELGTYTIQLIVNDGIQDSLPTTINIVREEPVIYTREIKGKLVDADNNGVANVQLARFGADDVYTDETGNFVLSLQSRVTTSGLSSSMFRLAGKLVGIIRFDKYEDESDSLLEVGDVLFPVFQRKDVSLIACEGYSGPNTVTVSFAPTGDSYENISFWQAVSIELEVGAEAIQTELPATTVLRMNASGTNSLNITYDGNGNLYTHQYQSNDDQYDPVELIVCDQ